MIHFKKAVELNPEVGMSHWYYGVVEIEKGNVEFGLDIIEKAGIICVLLWIVSEWRES